LTTTSKECIVESCQNPSKVLDLPQAEQQVLNLKAYQNGFNDRNMGRDKHLPMECSDGAVFSYNLGWRDGGAYGKD
jgi:hypothetical protein